MNNEDFNAMILVQVNNIKYLSNYSPTSFAICIIKEDPIILTSAMDKELANISSSIQVEEFKSYSDLIKLFKKERFKKIAIESSLPVDVYKKIEGKWDLEIKELVETERMVKSSEEISKMYESVAISHNSFKQLNIYEKQEKNVSEWELAYELGYLMRKNRATSEAFETIVASGSNSRFPHARCENKKLETPILMDWGCKFDGYCSDTSRTIVYNEKQEEIFDIVLEAHDKAIDYIKPGVKLCEIDKIARSIINEYGYADNFIHSSGHSLGLDIHEKPNVSKKDETILEKNMVITIEPGIYLEDEFGVRIEDMILVENKAKIMGNLPYKIS